MIECHVKLEKEEFTDDSQITAVCNRVYLITHQDGENRVGAGLGKSNLEFCTTTLSLPVKS